MINIIDNLHLKLIIIGPTPYFREGLHALCKEEWFRPYFSIKASCSPLERKQILKEIKNYISFFESLEESSKNVYLFNAFNVLCEENNTNCPLTLNEEYLYADEHHLTQYGSLLLKEPLIQFLKKENLVKSK